MGMNFNAYLDHKLDENEIYRFCHALNSNKFENIDRFVQTYPNSNIKREIWEVVPDHLGGTILVDGPGGLDFMFSEKVCRISHPIRWINFLLEDDIQKHFRDISFEMMCFLNSSLVIYVPDNEARESAILDFVWDDENRDIKYIQKWLLNECGPPKKKIKDIYQEFDDYWVSDGYYIDNFSDY
jgi:hypothetical protein